MSQRNKIILYVGGFELPDKNAAAHRVVTNGKIFRDLGYKVFFIGIDKDFDSNIDLNKTKSVFEDFTFYSVAYPKKVTDWYRFLFDVSYISLIESINPSLIIAYNYPGVALKKLLIFSKRRDIRLIADCTEWYAPVGNIIFKIIKGMDTWYRMKVVHKQLDGLITISKYLYNYYLINKKRVIYIPPLVDKSMKKWGNKGIYKNDTSKIKLIYAGSPGNGGKDILDNLIYVLIRLKKDLNLSVQLTIVGITKEQFIHSFSPNKFILDFLPKTVIFKGRLPHNDVLQLVKLSDFEIFIRKNNRANMAGFPTKFVEAISCGTPVLTNLTSDIGFYLKDGVNGFQLDLSSRDALYMSLVNIFSVYRYDIPKMKEVCYNSNEFDYRAYIEDLSLFLDGVYGSPSKTKGI